MNTHNICFCKEISKILDGYPIISGVVYVVCGGGGGGGGVDWVHINLGGRGGCTCNEYPQYMLLWTNKKMITLRHLYIIWS